MRKNTLISKLNLKFLRGAFSLLETGYGVCVCECVCKKDADTCIEALAPASVFHHCLVLSYLAYGVLN